MRQLTDEEIERQDFVDNAIFQMINDVNPTQKEIEWDIEMIGNIRDEINLSFAKKLEICSEQEFYPFIEIDE
jgi:hypothetical protein